MKLIHKKAALAAAIAATSIAAYAPAPAYAYNQPIYLELNQSYYLPQTSAIKRVAVTNPEIADVVVIDKNAINVIAKKTGSTSLTIWTVNGMRQDFTVSVTGADSTMATAIQKAIGLPHVEVTVIGNGDNAKILLKGTVQNQYEKDLAYRIACMYVSGNVAPDQESNRSLFDESVDVTDNKENNSNVVNLLEMVNPDQINIEAVVLEINSNDAAKLGATYTSPIASNDSSTTTNNGVTLGDPGEFYGGETIGSQRDKGSHWYSRNYFFTHFSQINSQIHLLIQNGHARVISRPNITTMSGKTAGILVGGQIPYPVSTGSNGEISVEYKDYGIRLNLIDPTADRSGNITSRVLASVSRLDWTNAVTSSNLRWPALATRTAETMINVPTGMTMVIGGLLDSDDTKTIQKVPLLGDIPILGELFKYHNNSKQKSEIMILITPHIVNETTPAEMSTKMKDLYAEDRQAAEAREQVDLNGETPKTDKQLKQEAKDKAKAEKEAQEQAIAKQKAADQAKADKAKADKQKAEQAKKDQAKKDQAKNTKPAKSDDSILGKYLDKDVLHD